MATEVHKLPCEWQFWVSKVSTSEYEIESIASFATIEDFWSIYLQFPQIEELRRGGLSLFKKGIRPAWEDPQNAGGQTARLTALRITKESWEHLVLAVIGGSLEAKVTGAPLCGISVAWTPRLNSLRAEIWYGRGHIDRGRLAAALGVDATTVSIRSHNARR